MNLLKSHCEEATRFGAFSYGRRKEAEGELAQSQETAALLRHEPHAATTPSRTDSLETQVSELNARLDEAELKCLKARQDGLAEGRALGRKEADSRETERLQTLGKSLEEASASLLERVDQERDLAIEIARATITRILGDDSAYADMVAATACTWADRLTASAVLRLHVSEEDFRDETALAALQARAGALTIVRDSSLEPGACRFDLKLGHLDASIPLQAHKADRMLAKHSTGLVAGQ